MFYPLLEVTSLKKHVCVKDSSAKGTCFLFKKHHDVFTYLAGSIYLEHEMHSFTMYY